MANSSRDNKVLQAGRNAAAAPRAAVNRPQSAARPANNGEEKLLVELPVLLEALGRLQQKRKKRAAELRGAAPATATAPVRNRYEPEVYAQTPAEQFSDMPDTEQTASMHPSPLFRSAGEIQDRHTENTIPAADRQNAGAKRILIRPGTANGNAAITPASSPTFPRKAREFLFLVVALAVVLGVCVHFGVIRIGGNGSEGHPFAVQIKDGSAPSRDNNTAGGGKEERPAPVPAKDNSKPVPNIKVTLPGKSGGEEDRTGSETSGSAITGVTPGLAPAATSVYNSTVNGIRYPDTGREPVVLESQNGEPVVSTRPGREDPFNYDIVQPKNAPTAPITPVQQQVIAPKEIAVPYAFSCELKLLAVKSSTGTPSIAIISHMPGDKTFYVKRGDTFSFLDKNHELHDLTVIEIGSSGVTVTYGEGAKQTLVIN